MFQLPRRSSKVVCLCTAALSGECAWPTRPGARPLTPCHPAGLLSVACSDAEAALYVGTASGELSAWQFSSEKTLDDVAAGGDVAAAPRDAPPMLLMWRQATAHTGPVSSLVTASDGAGQALVSGGTDMLVRRWSGLTGKMLSEAVTDGSATSSACFASLPGTAH